MQPLRANVDTGFQRATTVAKVDLFPLRASGGQSPSMALGTMPTRPALLVRLTDTEGIEGWGEIWANFPPRASLHKMHLVEDVVAPKLRGLTFAEPRDAVVTLRDALSLYFLHIGQERVFEHILAGLDTALWDLALRGAGLSFSEFMGLAPVAKCYASSINPADLKEKLATHAGKGQNHFKLKLGFGDEQDCAFVEAADTLCPPGASLMIDSNQKWSVDQAITMLDRLPHKRLLFSEEPIPASAPPADWKRLADATEVPLAAGENLYGLDEFLAMADVGVRYLQPDVAKWGGVTGALDLAAALPVGKAIWPHFMGTAVGQVAALCVTAAVGEDATCEMDVNTNGLRSELCGDALLIGNGAVDLPTEPGLVVPPNSEMLAKFSDTAS